MSVGKNGLRKHFATSGWVVGFGPRTVSGLRRKFCNGDLMKTLMLLEIYEFCCAGTAQLQWCWSLVLKVWMDDFRRRRYGGTKSTTR
jgi:hypothetical protein